jgi:hypothetical protein
MCQSPLARFGAALAAVAFGPDGRIHPIAYKITIIRMIGGVLLPGI